MKIAITSSGNSMDASIDNRFGRCSYFAFYDTETFNIEFIPNPNKDCSDGAGPASVQFVASNDVDKVVSGEFGMKIKSLFVSLGIQMIVFPDTTKNIREVIQMIDTQNK